MRSFASHYSPGSSFTFFGVKRWESTERVEMHHGFETCRIDAPRFTLYLACRTHARGVE
jgi:hypothetical protein